jgi:hypothetical protein
MLSKTFMVSQKPSKNAWLAFLRRWLPIHFMAT